MINPFWNSNERRLRALWRILIHGLLFLTLTRLLSSIVPALVGISLIGSRAPGVSPTDPAFIQSINQVLSSSAVLRAVMILLVLLASIATLALAGRFLDRRKLADYGLHLSRIWWADLGFGLALGAILMVFIFLFELAAGWVTITATFRTGNLIFPVSIFLVLLNFIQVGISEELLSRGYHLRNIAEGFNFKGVGPKWALWIGYLISSTMFGLFHLGNPNATWVSTLNIMLAGLLLGLGFILTRELAIPIGIHITWNFFQGNVFGFPVSGGTSSTSFIAIQQSGPELWTGGAFGPEAGVVGILAMLLGAVLILVWVRMRRGKAVLQTCLAEYTPVLTLSNPNLGDNKTKLADEMDG